MSFPASPSNGQLATINNITYQYSTSTVSWSRTNAVSGMLADYIQVYNATDDTGLTTNSTIIFDTQVSGSGIPYNTSTGVFTLTAGKTYELYANVNWNTFSDASGGYLVYQWVDATSGTALLPGLAGAGLAEAINRNTSESISPTVKIIYTPLTNQTVKLMITSASGTATARGTIGTNAQILQLGNSSLMSNVTIGGGATSTSTTTGAVIVNGGLAVQGNINFQGNLYQNGALFVGGGGSATTSTLTAGTYTVVLNTTGTLTVPSQITTPAGSNANLVLNPDGLADVVVTTSTQILMWATNTSISTTTGALIVTGGVGVGGTVTANKFVGDGSSLTNVTVTQQANIVGVQPNVTLVAGNYTYLFDNTGTFTMPYNGDIVMTGTNANLTVGGTTLLGGASQVVGYYSTLGISYPGGSTQYGMTLRPAADNTNAITFLNAAGTNIGSITQTTSTVMFNMPNRPAFRVYGAGTTNNLSTTVNTNGILNGNNFAVDYNQGTALSTSTGVFTAPIAGLYSIHLVARVTSNSAGQAQVTVIKNNGLGSQANQAMWETGPNPSVNHFGVSTIAKLAVGDTLVAKVTLGSINFDANDSWAVAYIG